MRIAVLTSSRADFGIYLPLLKEIKADPFFNLNIIAFGTHLSPFHGYTLDDILKEGIEVNYTVDSMLLGDSKESIATAMGLTMLKFATFWSDHAKDFDLVFCLGDRYEMFSAVMAGVPFQTKFAHLHGGEKTLGAIDNVFRHAISHASSIHFTATEEYKGRIESMVDESDKVYNVGSLSLDNILQTKLLTIDQFKEKWAIDLSKPTVLMTFHPETVNVDQNIFYTEEIIKVVKDYSNLNFIITMPNADTFGNSIRKIFTDAFGENKNVYLVENLGILSYFTAIKYCLFLLGNSSSGIIEAASFGKYVVNLGDRQKGRLCSDNIIHSTIKEEEIRAKIDAIIANPFYEGINKYYNDGASKKIINVLKKIKIQ